MVPLLTAAQMRALDETTIQDLGLPGRVLMETAGRAVADEACRHLPPGGRVVVVCGTGNNGGDGLVVARLLALRGHRVDTLLIGAHGDLRGDAAANLHTASRLGLEVRAAPDQEAIRLACRELRGPDLVVDALFGTGLARPLEGRAHAAVEAMNGLLAAPVLAVDIPSGVSADTGETLGVSVLATWTVALAFMKRGLVLCPGADRCGTVTVVDIGIPRTLLAAVPDVVQGMERGDARGLHRPRPLGAHKGSAGHVAVVGGSPGLGGALALACRGALRVGAGRVTAVAPSPPFHASLDAEVTTDVVNNGDNLAWTPDRRVNALVVGPGLAVGEDGRRLLGGALGAGLPVCLDAGALALLGTDLASVVGETARVLTPHPAELGRLLGVPTEEVQRDRVAAAREAARRSGAVVVNKGARSVVASPSGEVSVCLHGHPVLATGGTGDVLAGVVGALLAQGRTPWDAARLGVYLHARAGERWAARVGPQGGLARDLADEIPGALAELEA